MQLFIVRFFQDQFLVGVTGIIFNDKREVLLFKHTYRAHAWSLPGGYMKAGEHPSEGLEREIKEESGLIVSADTRLKTRTDRDSARLDICYIGAFIGGEFSPTHEVSEYGFFAQDKLPLLRKNQIFLIDEALKNF
ncbi:MAG: NUDIX hydrolase [Candidatus Pacebacteria bacterium GW2011_GWF1_36_5]|nr:MAG: NUDIX hydrolase [Candidatus Pacebacteria bacterium GW2011_GWF1_36_5]